MASQLAREIRTKLAFFVTDKISLNDLNDWLASILWDIEATRHAARAMKMRSGALGFGPPVAHAPGTAGRRCLD
jgi:hypothetical protein